MKVIYYGHSCFSVEAAGKQILFDPYISGNELAANINIEEIPADYILVSHGHYDHMLDVVSIASRTGAMVIGSFELYQYFSKQGLQHVQPLNPGGQIVLDFGKVKAFPAQHSSSFQDGSYAGLASGFGLQTGEGSFYYSGDTALTLDMTIVPKWAKLDFAVLPIGDVLTMGVDDAIEAAKLLQVTQVLGVHYDTFGFIKIDQADALDRFSQSGISLSLPKIGQSFEI